MTDPKTVFIAWAFAVMGVSVLVEELKKWAEQKPISETRVVINRLLMAAAFTIWYLILFNRNVANYFSRIL